MTDDEHASHRKAFAQFFTAKDLRGFSVKLKTHGQAWDGCNGGDELLVHFNARLVPLFEALERLIDTSHPGAQFEIAALEVDVAYRKLREGK